MSTPVRLRGEEMPEHVKSFLPKSEVPFCGYDPAADILYILRHDGLCPHSIGPEPWQMCVRLAGHERPGCRTTYYKDGGLGCAEYFDFNEDRHVRALDIDPLKPHERG